MSQNLTVLEELKEQIKAGKISFQADRFRVMLLGENTKGAKVTEKLQKLVIYLSKRAHIEISSVVRSAGHHGLGRAIDVGNETIAGSLLPEIATDAKVKELEIDELIFDATVEGKTSRNHWNYMGGNKHDYTSQETLDDHRDHIHFSVKPD